MITDWGCGVEGDQGWVAGVNTEVPNVARIYDYMIGGKNNFPADRRAADQLSGVSPYVRPAMIENRRFLRRAVRFLAEAGIQQFLDIGAGLPTHGNVHEIAREAAPESRVVYVDHDPVVLAHARALMTGTDRVRVVEGDVRRPEEILHDPVVELYLDWTEPVAVLMVGLLHFVQDADDPYAIVRRFREAMTPGSYLAIGHGSLDGVEPPLNAPIRAVYRASTAPTRLRSLTEITRFFDGFEPVDPGVVLMPWWRPEGPRSDVLAGGIPVAKLGVFGGVGKLRAPVSGG